MRRAQTLCAFTIQLVDTFIRDEEEEREESPLSFEREKNNSASEPFSSSREGSWKNAELEAALPRIFAEHTAANVYFIIKIAYPFAARGQI